MADQPIGGIKLEIAGDIRGLQKAVAEGKVSIEQLGQFLEQKLDKSTTSAERSVNRLVKELTGVRPTAQLQQLAVAVEKIGGTSKLTEVQVGNLQKKIEGLRAAGGNVPASLQNLTKSIEGVGAATDKLKTAGLQQLEGMSSRLGPLGGALSAIGPAGLIAAAGIGALGAAATGVGKIVMDAARWADGLQDVAAVLGTTWEATQRLQAGAAATGVDFNLLRDSIVKMQQVIVDAPEKLNNLGLSMDKLRSMAPEQQFEAIATQLQKIEDPARRNAIAMEVFGKKWADLVPFVEAGFEAMREATVVSDETVNGLGKISDAADKLKHNWDTLWNAMGGALGSSPAIVGSIEAITNALAGLSKEVSSGGLVSAAKWIALLSSGPGGFVNGVQMLADKGKGGSDPWGGWAPGMGALPSFNADGTIKRDGPVLGETETERKAREAREKEADRERKRRQQEAEREQARFYAAMDAYNEKTFGIKGGMGPLQLDEDGNPIASGPSGTLPIRPGSSARMSTLLDMDVSGDNAALRRYAETLSVVNEKTELNFGSAQDWASAVQSVSAAFKLLGISADTALGRTLGNLTNTISASGTLAASIASGNVAGMVQGGTQIAGAYAQSFRGNSAGSRFTSALSTGVGLLPAGISALFGSSGPQQGKGADTGFGSVDTLLDQLSDGFQRNNMSAREMGAAFDAAFNELKPGLIDQTTGLLTEQARELIGVAQNGKIASSAIRELMAEQAKGLAGNLGLGVASLKTVREQGATTGIAGPAAASAIGATFQADFAQLTAGGMSTREALEMLAPAIKAFREELQAAGYDGGAAFDDLAARVAVFQGEVTGPLVDGIAGFTGALANLSNMGQLTEQTFAGITAQISSNIEALQREGVEGPAAIAVLQPQLQTIWELQQRHGFEVDHTTQALIDMAVEGKQVGEQFKSAQDRMADAAERTASAVEALARALVGVGKAVEGIPGDKTINIRTNHTGNGPPVYDPPGEEMPEEFATGSGGIRNFGAGTPAILHGMEGVFTVGQINSMLTSAMTAAPSYSPSSTAGDSAAVMAEEFRAMRRVIEAQTARIHDAFRDAVEQLPRR